MFKKFVGFDGLGFCLGEFESLEENSEEREEVVEVVGAEEGARLKRDGLGWGSGGWEAEFLVWVDVGGGLGEHSVEVFLNLLFLGVLVGFLVGGAGLVFLNRISALGRGSL